jgi:hypothetical protein
MIEVCYQGEVGYPAARVLSQYFDLEHIEHVHPRSFGRARLLSQHDYIDVWELEWPSILGAIRFEAPFDRSLYRPSVFALLFIKGLFRGTESEVRLTSTGDGTLVEELHRIALPDWWFLRSWICGSWSRRLDRIWSEDLNWMCATADGRVSPTQVCLEPGNSTGSAVLYCHLRL